MTQFNCTMCWNMTHQYKDGYRRCMKHKANEDEYFDLMLIYDPTTIPDYCDYKELVCDICKYHRYPGLDPYNRAWCYYKSNIRPSDGHCRFLADTHEEVTKLGKPIWCQYNP